MVPITMSDEKSYAGIREQRAMGKTLEHNEFLALWNQWNETKDRRIFDQIFTANIRGAYVLAERASWKYKIEITDAYQAACIALMRAIEKYRPETGMRLTSFAWVAMQRKIQQEVARNRPMPIEARTGMRIKNLETVRAAMRCELQREPTRAELSTRLECKEKDIVLLERFHLASTVASTDSPVGGEEDLHVGDSIPAPDRTAHEPSAELAEKIASFVKRLKECDRAIVVHRIFAEFFGNVPLSFEKLGKAFRVTKQCIQQREYVLRDRLQRGYKDIFQI